MGPNRPLRQSPLLARNSAIPAATSGRDRMRRPTIKKRVDEVHVLFIATDRHGKFVGI